MPAWDNVDFDSGTDNGLVHESTPDTSYDNANEIRRGFSAQNPPFSGDNILFYLFQEDTEPVIDHSPNGNDATVEGATANARSIFGLDVWGLDGTNDYFDAGNLTNPDSITEYVWLYPTGTGGGATNKGIIDTGLDEGGGGSTGGARLAYDIPDSAIRYSVVLDDGTLLDNRGLQDWDLDEWNFIAQTWKRSSGAWRGYYASESTAFTTVFDESHSAVDLGDTTRPWVWGTVSFNIGGGDISGSFYSSGILDVAKSQTDIKQTLVDPVLEPATHTAVEK